MIQLKFSISLIIQILIVFFITHVFILIQIILAITHLIAQWNGA